MENKNLYLEKEIASKLAKDAGSKGGKARAAALSQTERSDIAKRAAKIRWNPKLLQATHEGDLSINGISVSAAVLPNGQRLLTQSSFLTALGRSRTPKAGTGVLTAVDGIPSFLQANELKPFISAELLVSTTPVSFCAVNGVESIGYDAQSLPQVAEVYLRLRDSYLSEGKSPPRQYLHIIQACDLLMRGLATIGIVALVDEATGYQYQRAKDALAQILEQYISKELLKWVKTFPDEFYEQIYRLQKWKGDPLKNRSQFVGKLTVDLVYDRLAPGVSEELKRLVPRLPSGNLKYHMHRRLSVDYGHPRLHEHLFAVIALMRASNSWDFFYGLLNTSFPKVGDTYQLFPPTMNNKQNLLDNP